MGPAKLKLKGITLPEDASFTRHMVEINEALSKLALSLNLIPLAKTQLLTTKVFQQLMRAAGEPPRKLVAYEMKQWLFREMYAALYLGKNSELGISKTIPYFTPYIVN